MKSKKATGIVIEAYYDGEEQLLKIKLDKKDKQLLLWLNKKVELREI